MDKIVAALSDLEYTCHTGYMNCLVKHQTFLRHQPLEPDIADLQTTEVLGNLRLLTRGQVGLGPDNFREKEPAFAGGLDLQAMVQRRLLTSRKSTARDLTLGLP